MKDEGDEAYLQTYKGESDDDSVHDLLEEPSIQSNKENDLYDKPSGLNLRLYDIPDDDDEDVAVDNRA